MKNEELEQRLSFATEIALEAGELALSFFRKAGLQVEKKGDGSPVSEADRGIEALLCKRIEAAFPEDGLLGEEGGSKEAASGATWILDPIDGTRSFVHGVPLFGTLIGLEVDGECLLGVAHHPGVNETIVAARGRGTRWWHGDSSPSKARVSDTRRLDEALALTTSIKDWDEVGRGRAFRRMLEASGGDRGWSDCYGLTLVATGRADLIAEPVLHPWDCAAYVPILEEAGGTFTDLNGERTIRGRGGLATNGKLHAEALAALSPTSE